MGEFVRGQRVDARPLALTEDNVRPDCESAGAETLGRKCIAVHSYITEIVFEPGLEAGAGRCVQPLAGRAQNLVTSAGTFDDERRRNRFAPWRLLLAFCAHPVELAWGGKPHHLIGETIGLVLERIIDGPEHEVRLHETRRADAELCRLRRKYREFKEVPGGAERCHTFGWSRPLLEAVPGARCGGRPRGRCLTRGAGADLRLYLCEPRSKHAALSDRSRLSEWPP